MGAYSVLVLPTHNIGVPHCWSGVCPLSEHD